MSKNFLFALDLISKDSFDVQELETLREKILSLDEGNEFFSMAYEVIQLTKDGRIEIYAEDTGISSDSGEEVLSFVKLIEHEVGGFISGSSFEVGKEHPGNSEKWVKVEYGWELQEEEKDEESWDNDAYWNDEWEDWNEEWN